jgi:hypothetical protein
MQGSDLFVGWCLRSNEHSCWTVRPAGQAASPCAEAARSILQQLAPKPQTPAAALGSMCLACGVNETILIQEGASAVMRSILQRYKPRISGGSWLRVCASMARMARTMQHTRSTNALPGNIGVNRLFQDSLHACRQAAPAAGNNSCRGGMMLPGLLVAVAQAVEVATLEELHAFDVAQVGQKGEPRRREAAMRLQLLTHYRGVAKVLVYEECPLQARKVELALSGAAAPTFEQVCVPPGRTELLGPVNLC